MCIDAKYLYPTRPQNSRLLKKHGGKHLKGLISKGKRTVYDLPSPHAQGRFTSSDYWFNQMYYGTHGPFKRAQAGQAITFENDKVR
jgi:hypothetical protein